MTLLVLGARLYAQDRVVGLLTLPEVLGETVCEASTGREIGVYESVDASGPAWAIRLDVPSTAHAAGGCDGPIVNVHTQSGQNIGELPTREFSYEASAAIVLERRDHWFRISLPDGLTGWIQSTPNSEMLSLEQLLTDGLTYLTHASDGRLLSAPGAGLDLTVPAPVADRIVRVIETREMSDGLWLRLEVLSESPCEWAGDPTVAVTGWSPAYAASGETTVWFHSRGC